MPESLSWLRSPKFDALGVHPHNFSEEHSATDEGGEDRAAVRVYCQLVPTLMCAPEIER